MAPEEKDDLRLCPTCRVPISVLATRCRHCGEEVGRPRKEEHKLTLKDLGGEEKTNYTISGNVMDALEAFREDEISQQDYRRSERESMSGSWFGKRNAPGAPKPRNDDMPELDAYGRDLAGLDEGYRPRSSRPAPPRRNLGPTLQDRLTQGGIAIAVLVFLYFAGTFTYTKYEEAQAAKEAALHPVYQSKALDLLAAGRPIVDVLGEAVEAVQKTTSPENVDALEKVRARVIEDVNKLLDAPAYSAETLSQASMLSTRAALKDSDPRLQELDRSVKAELDAYSLILMSTDVKTQKAKFKLHDPAFQQQEQEVGPGDIVGGRFVVQSILQNQVRLVDRQRKSPTGQRSILARPQEPVTGA